MTNFRFFYAEEAYNTWPKLFVLSEDGTLYSEYLDYNKPTTFKRKVNFSSFQPSLFKWNSYQSIVEIDRETATSKRLIKQENWVSRYLNSYRA